MRHTLIPLSLSLPPRYVPTWSGDIMDSSLYNTLIWNLRTNLIITIPFPSLSLSLPLSLCLPPTYMYPPEVVISRTALSMAVWSETWGLIWSSVGSIGWVGISVGSWWAWRWGLWCEYTKIYWSFSISQTEFAVYRHYPHGFSDFRFIIVAIILWHFS